MDLELGGKVVLVTGGSEGLGAAVARRLVREGAKVALCARGAERLEATAAALRAEGGDVLTVQADVSRAWEVEHFVDAAHARFGRIDGLVNNAGTAAGQPFASVSDAEWEADLQLKVFAAIRASRQALPFLKESGSGAIVNVLAIAAKTPGANSTPSSVSRAAGLALTKALSKELGPHAIRVNAVLVGIIESGQWARRAKEVGKPVESFQQEMARHAGIPLGRVGKAEEFADTVAFLLSPRGGYISGAAINVDGGLSAAV
ncbi:SDR family oxidoreductase [Myxococcus virescens]|uniref:NAD(P)-dependent dehydrogenase, short-chain alcohol dehydrogenase family n=1 Tax=Myxococcus virescens TaxID=83456 RepID=A0A511H7N8_9BACT|nr:SDR family oxidoreductase [Myxococcus virescens]GEL69552.1 short chain dehydrogenase [Myxococcus virescens]SDD25681.1 NAD(P)-dependent dehydrogenase, short-chain alcohol dehydrogenase family [Myxococcus virescens]